MCASMYVVKDRSMKVYFSHTHTYINTHSHTYIHYIRTDDGYTALFGYCMDDEALSAQTSNAAYKALWSKSARDLMDDTVMYKTMPLLLSAAYVCVSMCVCVCKLLSEVSTLISTPQLISFLPPHTYIHTNIFMYTAT